MKGLDSDDTLNHDKSSRRGNSVHSYSTPTYHSKESSWRYRYRRLLWVALLLALSAGVYWWWWRFEIENIVKATEQHEQGKFRLRHVLDRSIGREHKNSIKQFDVPKGGRQSSVGVLSQNLKAPKSVTKRIRRLAERDDPVFIDSYLQYARETRPFHQIDFEWVDEQVSVPDVTDRDTVIQLANMCQDAYVGEPHTGDWLNVSKPWHGESDFGWGGDSLRGHVFATGDNSTVVISLKGTSAAIFDNGGSTAVKDKVNDNLLFSCCCGRISYLWNTVCDCYTGESYTCNTTCLENQLLSEDRYYRAALDLYRNVTAQYPTSSIWMTGHSLGGSLSALVGRTYGVPAVAFEAPPELLATKRLHLPQPPGIPQWEDHIWHFGHTADPIFMGVCNGAGSSCWIGGYAMETKCHSGLVCVFDTVKEEGWYVSLVNHRILTVIHDLLEIRNTTAECKVPEPCQDCFNWKFVNPEVPPSHTTSSLRSSHGPTPTHTHTRQTRTGMPTVTQPPQKCLERTWYGRCIKWGPDEPDSNITTTTIALPTSTSTPGQSPNPPPKPPHECLGRTWYGRCYKWSDDDPDPDLDD